MNSNLVVDKASYDALKNECTRLREILESRHEFTWQGGADGPYLHHSANCWVCGALAPVIEAVELVRPEWIEIDGDGSSPAFAGSQWFYEEFGTWETKPDGAEMMEGCRYRYPATNWHPFKPSAANPIREGDRWRPASRPDMPLELVEASIGGKDVAGDVIYFREGGE